MTEMRWRYRVTFAVDAPLRYVAVLDMGRLWERLLRRARVGLAYSSGFTPHPALFIADALPVGYASDGELVDFDVKREIQIDTLESLLRAQCPAGLAVLQIQAVDIGAPKPQSGMRAAEYAVTFNSAETREQITSAIDALLRATTLPRLRQRADMSIPYDLRPLVYKVGMLPSTREETRLAMTLRCGSQGSGRPEEVVAALGITPRWLDIRRTAFHWDTEGKASA